MRLKGMKFGQLTSRLLVETGRGICHRINFLEVSINKIPWIAVGIVPAASRIFLRLHMFKDDIPKLLNNFHEPVPTT